MSLILKSKKGFIYRTLILRRLCNQRNAPDAIESKINEFLELLERKYMNGDSISFSDLVELDEERLKTSFPSTEHQIIDLAERLNLPLTTYSALQGYTCLIKKYLQVGTYFRFQFFRILIKSPYLKSTNALTYLQNMNQEQPTDLVNLPIITKVGTMKAYQYLERKNDKNAFEIDYVVESIILTGSYEDLINIRYKFVGFDPTNMLQTFKKKQWNDITRIPIIMSLLYHIEVISTDEQFLTVLKEFLTFIIATRVITKHEKDVILTLFESIKTHFNKYITQDITIFSNISNLHNTPFFLHLWLFQNYQIPLKDPIDAIITMTNLSYTHQYCLHFENEEEEYVVLNRSRITQEIVELCLRSHHIEMEELDWFIQYFKLHSILQHINTFLTICNYYSELNENRICSWNDIWKKVEKRYRWLIRNGSYQPEKLSTLFSTTGEKHYQSKITSNVFFKLLQLSEFKIDQESVDDIATTYMENGQIDYNLLLVILAICYEQEIKIRFPDTICFSTMMLNHMFDQFLPFLQELNVRKFTKKETETFMTEVDGLLFVNDSFIKKILDPVITYDCILHSPEIRNQQNNLVIFFELWPNFTLPNQIS